MIRSILQYAVPVVFSRLASVLLEVGSVAIVAFLGLVNLSAYGLVSPLYLAVYLVAISYLLVFSVRASKLKEDPAAFSRYVIASFVFGLCLSIVLMLIFAVVFPILLPFLGQSPKLVHLATHYFYLVALGMPALMCSVIMNQLFVVLKRKRFVLINSFVQLAIGLCLVYWLAVYSGFGLVGVALGFVLAFWIKALTFLVYLCTSCRDAFEFRKITRGELIEDAGFLLKLGWPVSMQYGGELLVGVFATMMIGHLYSNALAVQQMSTQLRVFFMMFPFGLSQACVILIAKKSDQLKSAQADIQPVLKSALFLGLLLALLLSILANVFSSSYTGFFIHEQSTYINHLARLFILMTSISLLFDTIKYILMGVMRALGNTKDPMKYSLSVYWLVGIPLAYFMGYYTNLGPVGVRLGMLLGLFFSVISLSVFFLIFIRRKVGVSSKVK